MINSNLAPILVFCYNRLDHLRATIDALRENTLASHSLVYIISDGAKLNDPKSIRDVDLVRNYIETVNGFGKVKVIKNDENLGLASSIIQNITKLIEEHKKVIVLEDDIITSNYFLEFMNKGLDLYKNSRDVWHISGWNYPLQDCKNGSDAFLWRGMNCWGWATWQDRWKHFNKDPNRLINTWKKEQVAKFNIDNKKNFFSQVKLNYDGKINTWAIFWYATIFENEGLCLNPVVTMTRNIGLDGSGTNCKSQLRTDYFSLENKVQNFPSLFCEDENIISKIKYYLKATEPGLLKRIQERLQRMLMS